jgi:hypothetical protein
MTKNARGAAGNIMSHSGINRHIDKKLITMTKSHKNAFKPSTVHDPRSIVGYTKIKKVQIYFFILIEASPVVSICPFDYSFTVICLCPSSLIRASAN